MLAGLVCCALAAGGRSQTGLPSVVHWEGTWSRAAFLVGHRAGCGFVLTCKTWPVMLAAGVWPPFLRLLVRTLSAPKPSGPLLCPRQAVGDSMLHLGPPQWTTQSCLALPVFVGSNLGSAGWTCATVAIPDWGGGCLLLTGLAAALFRVSSSSHTSCAWRPRTVLRQRPWSSWHWKTQREY